MPEQQTDLMITYTIKMPKSIRVFFEEIATQENRDLSFIIRRVLKEKKQEIESKDKTNWSNS